MQRGFEQMASRDPYGLEGLSMGQLEDAEDEAIAAKVEARRRGDDASIKAADARIRAIHAHMESVSSRPEAGVERGEDTGPEYEPTVAATWRDRYAPELEALDEARVQLKDSESEVRALEQAVHANESRFMSRPELAASTNEGMRRRIEQYRAQQAEQRDVADRLSIFEELRREAGESEDEFGLRRDIQQGKIDLYYAEERLHEMEDDDVGRRRLEREVQQLRHQIEQDEDTLAEWRDQRRAA